MTRTPQPQQMIKETESCSALDQHPLCRMGGMVPVGKRLLLQTSAFLYCIGEK